MSIKIPDKRRRDVGSEEMLKDIMAHEARAARADYEKWKLENEANPTTQRLNKLRLIMQIKSKKEKEILQINMRACKDMAAALKTAILSDLNLKPGTNQYSYDVTKEEIKEVINWYSAVLKEFENTANQIPPLKKLNYYESFFISLLDYSINFIYFAPDRCFEYSNIEFSRLSKEERLTELKPFLEEKGVLNDELFVSRYGKFFDLGHTV